MVQEASCPGHSAIRLPGKTRFLCSALFRSSNYAQLNPATLQVAHANRTLVVSVDKPDAMIIAEEAWRDQRKKLGLQKDGDVQCPQQ
jgi:hypothetical protein